MKFNFKYIYDYPGEQGTRMNTCPLCGIVVDNTSSTYQIILSIEDVTRSTKQFMGDESPVTRLAVNRQLCADCWDDLYDTLDPPEDN